jgi:hypothetical protein
MYTESRYLMSASAGAGHIHGSDVIDVIHAIEFSNDQALAMFGGRTHLE